jgi:hypothetical protein
VRSSPRTPQEIIEQLALEPLPDEGGFFRRTYTDGLDAIYYLIISPDFSALHRLAHVEVFHFYAGAPAKMLLLHCDGTTTAPVIGLDLLGGHRPQVVVTPGTWQATESLGEWTLLGATASPPYTPDIFELGQADLLSERWPTAAMEIRRLARR